MTEQNTGTRSAQQRAQKLFDTVVNHLRAQGKKAMNDEQGMCMYRAPDGSKCAAGCLIPDEMYTPDMEGNNLEGLIFGNGMNELAELFGPDLPLVKTLQHIHDGININQWEAQFQSTAANFNLNYTAPVQS